MQVQAQPLVHLFPHFLYTNEQHHQFVDQYHVHLLGNELLNNILKPYLNKLDIDRLILHLLPFFHFLPLLLFLNLFHLFLLFYFHFYDFLQYQQLLYLVLMSHLNYLDYFLDFENFICQCQNLYGLFYFFYLSYYHQFINLTY